MAHNSITSCDGIIILSLDSLFSLPEYRTDEKILSLVTEMAEKLHRGNQINAPLILQTRLKNTLVIKQLTMPSFRDVYTTLLKEREQHLLPPYYTVIKASFDNLTDDLRKKFEQGRTIQCERYDMGARHTTVAGFDRVLQIERRVGW